MLLYVFIATNLSYPALLVSLDDDTHLIYTIIYQEKISIYSPPKFYIYMLIVVYHVDNEILTYFFINFSSGYEIGILELFFVLVFCIVIQLIILLTMLVVY